MTEFERFLRDSLKAVGEAYEPRDVYGAKQRFLQRRRRRRWMLAAGGLASATAVVVAALLIVQPQESPRRARPGRPSDLALAATVAVGRGPAAVAIGHGSAWVANSDGGSVSRIDLMSNEVTDTISTGGRPDEIAVSPDAVWVTNAERGSVQRIDPVLNQLAAEIVIAPGDRSLTMDLAIGEEAIWVAALETESIHLIDLRGSGPFVPETLQASGTDVASDGQQVWAMDAKRGRIVRVAGERTGPNIIRIPRQDAGPNTDLAVGHGALWVALGDAGTVTRVNLATSEDSATAVGGGYSDLATGPDA
ncbi:MAG TPA: hypothetical protein VHJ82_04170, partial [Actinomycetota bacterium]|nr:hypothetical protein [Actinomycetota bacterium]